MSHKADLPTSLRALAEETRRLEPHPPPEEWTSYHRGDLSPEAAERLQDHLAVCPDCADLVLDLDAFQRIGERQEERTIEPNAVAWEALRHRLPAEGRTPSASPRLREKPWVRRVYSWAPAAVLVLMVAGLSFWVRTLEGTLGRLAEPRLNVPLTDLMPEADARRAGGSFSSTLRVPRGQDRFVVILNIRDPLAHDRYALEIIDSRNRVLWSAPAIERGPDGNLTMELSRRFLPGGEYRVRLNDSGGSRAPVAQYSLTVQYE